MTVAHPLRSVKLQNVLQIEIPARAENWHTFAKSQHVLTIEMLKRFNSCETFRR